MADGFRAKVKHTYPLKDKRVLVLEPELEGEVVAGEWVEVDLPGGESQKAQVESIAWGSAFHAEESPLTLVLVGLEGPDPAAGAEVRGSAAEG